MKQFRQKKLFLLLLLFIINSASYGQDTNARLDGRYSLQHASTFRISGSDTVALPLATARESYFFLYDTIDIKGDTIAFPDPACDCIRKGLYTRNGASIDLTFTAAPYTLVYRRDGSTLLFEQTFSHYGDSSTYRALFTYKPEEDETNKNSN